MKKTSAFTRLGSLFVLAALTALTSCKTLDSNDMTEMLENLKVNLDSIYNTDPEEKQTDTAEEKRTDTQRVKEYIGKTQVGNIQRYLNEVAAYKLNVDGILGEQTKWIIEDWCSKDYSKTMDKCWQGLKKKAEQYSTQKKNRKSPSPGLSPPQNRLNVSRLVAKNKALLLASKDCPNCYLYAVDLNRSDLAGANLEDANLKGANLSGANLAGANLAGANLRGAKLSGADLRYTYMVATKLQYANIDGAKFSGAKLTRSANKQKPQLEQQISKKLDPPDYNQNFRSTDALSVYREASDSYICSLSVIDSSGWSRLSNLVNWVKEGQRRELTFNRCQELLGAKKTWIRDVVTTSYASETDTYLCNLVVTAGENWSKEPQLASLLKEVRRRGLNYQACVYLRGEIPVQFGSNKRLRQPKKQKTQSKKINLSENLEMLKSSNECLGCSFKEADLQDANLESAKLSGTNMQGANLSGAKLKGADFQNADFWKTDLENADLRNVNFKGARFMQVSLKGAKLAGANFEDADLRFVNLEGANTVGANFNKAKLFATKIKQSKTKLLKKPDVLKVETNQPSSSKEMPQESPTRKAVSPDQVASKQTSQTQQSVSVSRLKVNTEKRFSGNNKKELASLTLQEPRQRDQFTSKNKSRFSKNNFRPAEGTATAIHTVGTGGMILAGFSGGRLNLVQMSDGKTISRFKGHTGTIRTIAVDPDAQIAASGADDHAVILWNLKTGKKIGVLNGHSKKVSSLSFSRDGRFLLSGSADKTVRVWNVAEQASTAVYEGHKGEVSAIVTLPGKPIAISASASAKDRSVIKVWNYQNSIPLGNLTGHRGPVYALAVSLDGKKLVSGSRDRTLKIWNIKLKRPIKTLGVLDGHRGAIRSVVIADKGRLIASGSDDKTIIVWSAKSGEIIDKIKKHKAKILGITLSSNSKFLFSSAADKSVRVWKLVGNKYSAVN